MLYTSCILTVIERPDVSETPALVEHGRLHAVVFRGMTLDGVGVVEAEGVLELVVHVGDPAAVVLGIAVLGQLLDLVLELLQAWRETGEKRETRIRPLSSRLDDAFFGHATRLQMFDWAPLIRSKGRVKFAGLFG